MSRYDDPHAYKRRWSRLSPADLARLSDADPLLFVADHIGMADRDDGVIALHADMASGQRLMVVVTPGPKAPSADECRSAVVGAIARLSEDHGDPEGCLDMPPVLSLGLVVHRRGPARVTPLDQRWSAALVAGCADWDVEALGVLVRTESGALVRPALPLGMGCHGSCEARDHPSGAPEPSWLRHGSDLRRKA
ncbi:MAG: hypothetical protein ACYC90_08980 [Candidatus Nanopelagicales bacterium]